MFFTNRGEISEGSGSGKGAAGETVLLSGEAGDDAAGVAVPPTGPIEPVFGPEHPTAPEVRRWIRTARTGMGIGRSIMQPCTFPVHHR